MISLESEESQKLDEWIEGVNESVSTPYIDITIADTGELVQKIPNPLYVTTSEFERYHQIDRNIECLL